MDGMPHDANAPQLRTLLLTDLCDSTALVEKLGDGVAATLFRDHDRLVLELQQRWRGRLIDRSDGLLLLFERPLDGLGFALDYRRGLDALGRAHRVGPLLARAGLHVGEVLIWRNSEEAVNAGAKPVEVEGLAKPFAARLMQLARPGQILLSSVVEPLLRRSARELGERGDALQWRTHGRWLFKGVPEVQEVHEVGEPGLAPLRGPRGDAKARRDIPAWRRPAALAAEVVLATGMVVGGWFMTRPEPAIAFSERDWVVVGDLRNMTGQTVLDDSLEQAFRLSLEQSRYVNVLSELKVRDTLSRMGRPMLALVDREVGSEVAIRDGALGLVLPSVSEVGGQVHVSLELVDPRTRETLFSTSAYGVGMESTLESIDEVTASLRSALGEGSVALSKDSKPLPQVATRSLDALRAYALGQEAYGTGNYVQARDFYKRAISFDPEFALAHIGVMRAYSVLDQQAEGMPYLRKAQELRANLKGRDQVYLDAWVVQLEDPEHAADAWMQMAKMYPDYFPALTNTAFALEVHNSYEQALDFASRAAVKQSEFAQVSMELLGRLRLARGEFDEARRILSSAGDTGTPGMRIWQVAALAAAGDFAAAEKLWPPDDQLKLTYFERVSMYLDEGKWRLARAEADRVHARAGKDAARFRQSHLPLAVALWAMGDADTSKQVLRSAVDAALTAVRQPTSGMDQRDDATLALHAALLAQRMGDPSPAAAVSAALKENDRLASIQPVKSLATVLAARQLILAEKPDEAIASLNAIVDGTEPLQARVALMEAYMAAGEADAALVQARWLAGNRGRAYAEYGCAWCQQGLNVVDARLAERHAAALAAAAGDRGVLDRRLEMTRLPPAQTQ
ncbi:putative peptide modification system cyclase [Pseudoxanthomonas sp. 10H]|uniref:putative peptide modification system cyclase n=1 Tax=Pseudoxanthomonas sp. 10H TaxID=3242729 RepID=UPI00355850DD